MRKIFSVVSCVLLAFSLTACGNTGSSTSTTENSSEDVSTSSAYEPENFEIISDEPSNSEMSKILVAYFYLANEQYEVGVIERGNTQIIAEIIAEKTGADTFSITATTTYPTTYNELLDISRREESNPPELFVAVENMDDYNTVFIGYPIWWGDRPTIVKVFLESHDLSGKTVIPFCTHAGSGLSGTQRSIESLCTSAEVKDGLAIKGTTAQNDQSAAENIIADWLMEIGIND